MTKWPTVHELRLALLANGYALTQDVNDDGDIRWMIGPEEWNSPISIYGPDDDPAWGSVEEASPDALDAFLAQFPATYAGLAREAVQQAQATGEPVTRKVKEGEITAYLILAGEQITVWFWPNKRLGPDPTPTPRPSYATLSSRAWAKVVKSPDTYTDKTYQVWGCIRQFDAATGPEAFLADASYKKETYWGLYGDNAAFTGDADQLADFVEGDIVSMSVTVLGSLTYDTQIGGSTTVPQFQVDKIQLKGSCD